MMPRTAPGGEDRAFTLVTARREKSASRDNLATIVATRRTKRWIPLAKIIGNPVSVGLRQVCRLERAGSGAGGEESTRDAEAKGEIIARPIDRRRARSPPS